MNSLGAFLTFTLGHLLSLFIFKRSVSGGKRSSKIGTFQIKQLLCDMRNSLANTLRLINMSLLYKAICSKLSLLIQTVADTWTCKVNGRLQN